MAAGEGGLEVRIGAGCGQGSKAPALSAQVFWNAVTNGKKVEAIFSHQVARKRLKDRGFSRTKGESYSSTVTVWFGRGGGACGFANHLSFPYPKKF